VVEWQHVLQNHALHVLQNHLTHAHRGAHVLKQWLIACSKILESVHQRGFAKRIAFAILLLVLVSHLSTSLQLHGVASGFHMWHFMRN
jgi:hypothetical protein